MKSADVASHPIQIMIQIPKVNIKDLEKGVVLSPLQIRDDDWFPTYITVISCSHISHNFRSLLILPRCRIHRAATFHFKV